MLDLADHDGASDGASPRGRPGPLAGQTVATLFAEPSTRTRVSFELAARALGGDPVSLDAASSSLAKGESLIDTVRTLEALGPAMLVVRHPRSGAPQLASEHFGGPVLNAGDGWHAHPTQALLDLYTLRNGPRRDRSLLVRKVCIVGDVLHSRVARSDIWALTCWGIDVWLTGPTVFLRGFEAWARALPSDRRLTVTGDLAAGITDAAAVMALRVQRERLEGAGAPSEAAYAARWGLTEERLRRFAPESIVMHPGPVNEGVELPPEVASGPRSVITRQVANGVPVRMAAMALRRRRARRHGRPTLGRRGMSTETLLPGAVIIDLTLEDAWLVDPVSGRSGRGSVTIEDGVLVDLAWGAAGGAPPSVVVAPSFVDLRAHIREPGGEEAETFATGLDAAAHGGFGFVASMADTRPPVDRPEVVQRVLAAGAATGSPVRTRPYGTVTVGREATTLAPFASLVAAGVVGFSDLPVASTDAAMLRAALTEAGALGMPVIVHPDEPSLTAGCRGERGTAIDDPGVAGRIRGGRGQRRLSRRGRAPPGERRGTGGCPTASPHRASLGGRIAGARPYRACRRAPGHL